MTERKRLAEDATMKAALAAGRDAVKRAVTDGLMTDEEKAARDAEGEEAAKKRRWKRIAVLVLGLLVVLGVVGLVLSYWYWFLGAGIAGLAALYAWRRLRGPAKPKDQAASPKEEKKTKKKERAPAPVRVAAAPVDAAARERAAEQRRAESAARTQELVEARAAEEREVDDELARMKARLKK